MGYLERTSAIGYAVKGPPSELLHAGAALEAVEAHFDGKRILNQSEEHAT